MTSPTLGTTSTGAAVPLELDRLIETRLLIQGASGSGKSFAVRRLLEETHGRVQHLVVDVEGEYATLRERFDYVLAGPGGDCPAEPRHADLLARRLLELGVSAIVDLHDMKPRDRPRFVRGFCDALVAAPRALWHDVLVVIEECHLFAPQGGREAESLASVVDLATRGRKRGFALVAVTQRISDLHKSVVAQCGNRLIGLTTLDADVKRAAYELGFEGRDQARQLAELKRGEFFGFGPAVSPKVIQLGVGPVTTTHAQRRGSRAAPPPPAPEKVRAILGKLADLPKEAEEEARTVDTLGRKVRDLERDLRTARAGAPDPEAIERAREEGRQHGLAERHAESLEMLECAEGIRDALLRTIQDARDVLDATDKRMAAPEERMKRGAALLASDHAPRRLSLVPPTVRTALPRPAPRAVASSNGHIPEGERLILTAAAQYPEGVTREQASILSGYKRSSRDTYISRLIGRGYAEVRGDLVIATNSGKAALGSGFEPLPTGAALREYWLDRLPLGEREALRVVIEAYPDAIDREAVGDTIGYKRSSRDTYLSRLATRKLVVAEGRGTVRASDTLFS